MSNDHLKNTREKSLQDDSNISEAELHATHPDIKEQWLDVQKIRREYSLAKIAASKAVDDEFLPRIQQAESEYAMILTLTR